MSGPTVTPVLSKWGWMLVWGRETFYDERRCLRTWNTQEEAVTWYNQHGPAGTTLSTIDKKPPDAHPGA